MKILQVNKFFFPKGGSETYFFGLSQALEAAGHEVISFSMKDKRNLPSAFENYFIEQIDFQSEKTVGKAVNYIHSKEAARKITELVKATRPDVAHLHNIAHQLTPSIIEALKKLGIPVIQTLHDYQLICPNYKLYTKGSPCERCFQHQYWQAIRNTCVQDSRAASTLAAFEMGFHNLLLRSYERGIEQFVAPSKFLYDTLLKWGWKESQVTYCPHFVKKERRGIQKKPQVIFVGRLVKEKGVHLFLEAAQQIRDVDFVIAGDGEERAAIEQGLAGREMSHCRFVGFQSGESLDELIEESLALVIPSLWYENAPLVVYEALALGTPVIAADHGGLPELIQLGVSGALFTPNNAQDLVATLRAFLASAPIHPPENRYTLEMHMKKITQLYESAITKT